MEESEDHITLCLSHFSGEPSVVHRGILMSLILIDTKNPANQSAVLSLDKTSTVRGFGPRIYKDTYPETLIFSRIIRLKKVQISSASLHSGEN